MPAASMNPNDYHQLYSRFIGSLTSDQRQMFDLLKSATQVQSRIVSTLAPNNTSRHRDPDALRKKTREPSSDLEAKWIEREQSAINSIHSPIDLNEVPAPVITSPIGSDGLVRLTDDESARLAKLLR